MLMLFCYYLHKAGLSGMERVVNKNHHNTILTTATSTTTFNNHIHRCQRHHLYLLILVFIVDVSLLFIDLWPKHKTKIIIIIVSPIIIIIYTTTSTITNYQIISSSCTYSGHDNIYIMLASAGLAFPYSSQRWQCIFPHLMVYMVMYI